MHVRTCARRADRCEARRPSAAGQPARVSWRSPGLDSMTNGTRCDPGAVQHVGDERAVAVEAAYRPAVKPLAVGAAVIRVLDPAARRRAETCALLRLMCRHLCSRVHSKRWVFHFRFGTNGTNATVLTISIDFGEIDRLRTTRNTAPEQRRLRVLTLWMSHRAVGDRSGAVRGLLWTDVLW